MSLLATQADFEPTEQQGATALYYQPADGSGYKSDFPFFQTRIDMLKGHFTPSGQKLAIWGCGWGSLVNLAVAAGYDAYGFDASSYAITRGKSVFPGIASRLFVRDALTSASVNGSRGDAGLRGQQRFALLVTEDLLTCMSDAEIATSLPLLRGACSSNLLHMVTPPDPWAVEYGLNDPRINWKSDEQWAALLNPPDAVYDCVSNLVVVI